MKRIEALKTRILVIDDEESVRESFRAVLCPGKREGDAVDAAAAALFGNPEPAVQSAAMPPFEVDFAASGKLGLALVEAAVLAKRPYAVIFCDMRMHGWDGLETVERVRRVDVRAEVIFVTAYSDHSVDEIVEQVGGNVGYYVKPFAGDELRQLATKCVLDWNRARELEALMDVVTSIRADRNDIDRLLRHLLEQVCAWLGTDSAALAQTGRDVVFRVGVGEFADAAAALPILHRGAGPEPSVDNGVVVLPISEFGLIVALKGDRKITADRMHLLRMFMEHASVAIQNTEMHARLAETQRMSAVGQALAFLIHDMRGPVMTARQLLGFIRDDDESVMSRAELFEASDKLLAEALDLVSDTLAFSRGGTNVQPERVALWDALKTTLESARAALMPRGIQLTWSVPAGLHARLDTARFSRVLRNLISNAAEAIEGLKDPQIRFEAREISGGVEFRVADNGRGLSAEVRAKLFEPFNTAGKRGGTGFGLAIVHQLVQAHGGRISAESGPEGTHFQIFMPHEV
jgi:two-component system, NtrC family, sensor kinase